MAPRLVVFLCFFFVRGEKTAVVFLFFLSINYFLDIFISEYESEQMPACKQIVV